MSWSLHGLLAVGSLLLAFVPGAVCRASKSAPSTNGVVPVRLVKAAQGYELLRDGKPYFIRGAGGSGSLEMLRAAGGNSTRTWGADNLDPLLAEADRLGLTVAVGIWLGHEDQGFSYNNVDQVAEQYERARQTILRYRNHPSVLLWSIGNEMEGTGDNAAIWSAVNNIASMAKALDPAHPTMTVIAEVGGSKVKNLHRLCPAIDIVGINSYAGIVSLPRRYREAGGTKPYIVTEFGPQGPWEVPKNAWGAAAEATSTQKAEQYRRGYEAAVASQKGFCLGSYAFTWGHKQETTSTWFGMFLPDGSRLDAVDVMTELWSGKPPANRCPVIESLKIQGPDQVAPGTIVRASLDASDPEHDPLTAQWVLQSEPTRYSVGGAAETAPPAYPDAIVKGDIHGAEVRMPPGGGHYRLYVYVRDGRGGAATANEPLRVLGPEAPAPPAPKAVLPLVIYDEADRAKPTYVPSGWMGNTKAIQMDERSTVNPHSGKTCIRCSYSANSDWAGVVWQDPPNDWGDQPGGWNLTGASRLTFWARGAKGGEALAFQFGLIGRDKPFPDTAQGKLDVKLTDRWQQYSLDLHGKDLSRIKSGFAWVATAAGAPVTFYLDDIRYE